jgi:hypothetical protein
VDEACSTHGRDVKCTQTFTGIPEEKRPLGEPRRDGNVMLE